MKDHVERDAAQKIHDFFPRPARVIFDVLTALFFLSSMIFRAYLGAAQIAYGSYPLLLSDKIRIVLYAAVWGVGFFLAAIWVSVRAARAFDSKSFSIFSQNDYGLRVLRFRYRVIAATIVFAIARLVVEFIKAIGDIFSF